MLDGASRIRDLISFAKAEHMPGIALTDHGVMYGAVKFYKEAKSAGIKPIMGCEVYVAADLRDRSRAPYYHLTLLARTAEGYRNLIKLCTAGFLEGFYRKPRVDMELLRRHGRGIICLSGCLSAEVPTRILEGRIDEARKLLREYAEIFDAVYLELQDHLEIPAQKRVNEGLFRLHAETGLDLVATNDSHYTARSDSRMHDVLLCIGTGKFYNDPKRMKFTGQEFYVKSAEEMARLFPKHPEALENTLKVVDLVEDVGIELGTTRLPNFPKPAGYTADNYLRERCEAGLVKRYGRITPDIQRRLDFELSTIEKMGFADYFLIVWDFVKYAKDRKIAVGPGRGSAAGSIVAYALEITDLDPLEYSLLFERFLNPDRISMPDVDIDFSVQGRGEVMRYVTDKYGGYEHVAQIITFGTIGAKAAIRDSGRIFQYPYSDTDKLAKFIPEKPVGTTLRDVLMPGDDGYITGDKHPGAARDIIQFVERDEAAKQVLDTAFEIEGFARHAGTHAAGVVISEEPLTDIVPLQTVKKTSVKSDPTASEEEEQLSVMVQHPMSDVEALGLLKVDFLGLRNLDVIEETLETIKETTGEEVDIRTIPLDDEETLNLFARGDTFGVFQFESSGMQRMLQEVRPDRFDDLVALNALYRPGPMDYIPNFKRGKHDPESVKYLDPRLKPILEPTYGVAAYQEQLMEISKALGGFTPGEADTLRKAIGKKNVRLLAPLKDKFIGGCSENRVVPEVAEELWNWMEKAGGYSFNKSHSACYSFLAFQTAYLKAHYPEAYMAALMSSVMNTKDRVPQYVAEARAMKIRVLPPDVNESGRRFTVVGDTIRFGLSAVKNVGDNCVEAIIAAREEGGPFEDIFDFCERVEASTFNKRTLESLVKCGAFDGTGHPRAAMLEVHGLAVERVARGRGGGDDDQFCMFDSAELADLAPPKPEIPAIEDDRRLSLEWEKETLGLFVSDHPLRPVLHKLKKHADTTVSELDSCRDGEVVWVGGLATSVRVNTTRKGDQMAMLQLDDTRGLAEVIVFPRVYASCAECVREDAVLKVKGRVERKEGLPRIVALEMEELHLEPGLDPVYLHAACFVDQPRSAAQKAFEIVGQHRGSSPLFLVSSDGALEERIGAVEDSSELHAELKQILGPRCISYTRPQEPEMEQVS
ncbi:MAG: polc: polymerase alpha subunit [Rubrobacteraceae bacterium]|nr:polc: polymerase alpha subunit [Rubrobacteraceae bacterium]